jgi:DNA mismatch repair protein MLH1
MRHKRPGLHTDTVTTIDLRKNIIASLTKHQFERTMKRNERIFLQVHWETEKECFQTFAKECSSFYAFKPDPYTGEAASENGHGNDWRWTVEHVLFPAFRCGLVPPKHLAEDGTLLQVANLPDLYKVFERC